MLTLETLKHIQDHNDFHHNRALSDMQIRNGTTRDKISAFFSHSCPWEIVNGERTSGLNIWGERERERYTVQKRVRKHLNTAKNESKFLDQGKERERRNVKLFVSSSFSLWKKKVYLVVEKVCDNYPCIPNYSACELCIHSQKKLLCWLGNVQLESTVHLLMCPWVSWL